MRACARACRQNIAFEQTWRLLLRLRPNCRTGKQMAMNAMSPWFPGCSSHTHRLREGETEQSFVCILQFYIPPQVMNYVMQHYCIGPLFLDAGCLTQ